MEKNQTTTVFKVCWYTKFLDVTANLVSRMLNVTVWLTTSSLNSVSILFYKLRSRFLCRGTIAVLIHVNNY